MRSEADEVLDGELCPSATGLSVTFDQYAVASYADGPQQLDVGGDDWKKYFQVNAITEAVFGGK